MFSKRQWFSQFVVLLSWLGHFPPPNPPLSMLTSVFMHHWKSFDVRHLCVPYTPPPHPLHHHPSCVHHYGLCFNSHILCHHGSFRGGRRRQWMWRWKLQQYIKLLSESLRPILHRAGTSVWIYWIRWVRKIQCFLFVFCISHNRMTAAQVCFSFFVF